MHHPSQASGPRIEHSFLGCAVKESLEMNGLSFIKAVLVQQISKKIVHFM